MACHTWEAYEEGDCGTCNSYKNTCINMGFYAGCGSTNGRSLKMYLKTDNGSSYCLDSSKKLWERLKVRQAIFT
ncbi:hypothetical protein X975_15294, partial [Stegodyphus mimosarum]